MRGFIECCCGLYVESLARQVNRDIRHEVLTTGKKPRDAFAEEVQVGIPAFNKVQPQLARPRAKSHAITLYMADPFGILAAIGGLEEIEKYSRWLCC